MEPINKEKELIDAWHYANEHLIVVKRDVTRAECDLANAKNALGKWITPGDAKKDEQFCIWCGNSLLTVTKHDSNYTIVVRTRGGKQ